MGRTLTDGDIEAIACRIVEIIGTRLAIPALPPPNPPAIVQSPAKVPAAKLAYSLKDLSDELGLSRASIYRLVARGLLKPLPYLRTKHFTRREVERFLEGRVR